MNTINPYEPPLEQSPPIAAADATKPRLPLPRLDEPAISTERTILPRHLAANLDMMFAFVSAVIITKSIPNHYWITQGIVFALTIVAYYFILEGLFGRTLGKLLMGLVVVQLDGRKCTWRQTMIRTAFRLLEVNPLLLGAFPAAILIISSRNHQRFGDKAAGTVVVFAKLLRNVHP